MKSITSILFLTFHFPPEVGGIQTRITKYIDRLSQRGVRVKVIVAGRNGVVGGPFHGTEIIPCPGGMKRLPFNIGLVTRSLLVSRADVVHVFTGSSTILGVATLALARSRGAMPVMSIFGREDLEFRSFLAKVLFIASTNLAKSIDVNSTATGSLLPERLASKTHVLMGGADEPKVLHRGSKGPPTILFVGRLVARKGVDDLLRAFATVLSERPDAKLSIVGSGPEMKSLTALASSLLLSRSIEFKGTLSGERLDSEYEDCTVLVLPSKDVASDPANEGLGLALIEASMHGKPLIGTCHGGIPEIVKEGQNGLLVPPADPVSLAAAILKVLDDGEMAESMGAAARKQATERFSWDRATDVLLQTYTRETGL